MNKKIGRSIENNFPYIIVFFMALFFEIVFYQRAGDELTIFNNFFNQYGSMTINNYLSFLKATMRSDILYWSSRTIIDFVSVVLIFCEPLWKVINAFMYAILVKALCLLFNFDKNEYAIIVCAIIALVPQTLYLGAGWLMTSIAYFWPVVSSFAAFALLVKSSKKHSILKNIIISLLVLYAANEEIMCVVLFFAFPVVAYNLKELRKQCFAFEGIVVLELLWALFCPGNQGRSVAEESRWFMDFSSLSVIKKMDLGFSTTMKEFLLCTNYVLLVLSIIILILGLKKAKGIIPKIITMIPFFAAIIGVGVAVLKEKSGVCSALYNSVSQYGSISVYNYDNIKSYIPLTFFVFVGGTILLSVLIIGEFSKEAYGLAILLLMGVASRCVMGFSPTVWASGSRTFSIMYYLIAFAILKGIQLMREENMKSGIKIASLVIFVCSMISISQFVICFV